MMKMLMTIKMTMRRKVTMIAVFVQVLPQMTNIFVIVYL